MQNTDMVLQLAPKKSALPDMKVLNIDIPVGGSLPLAPQKKSFFG